MRTMKRALRLSDLDASPPSLRLQSNFHQSHTDKGNPTLHKPIELLQSHAQRKTRKAQQSCALRAHQTAVELLHAKKTEEAQHRYASRASQTRINRPRKERPKNPAKAMPHELTTPLDSGRTSSITQRTKETQRLTSQSNAFNRTHKERERSPRKRLCYTSSPLFGQRSNSFNRARKGNAKGSASIS